MAKVETTDIARVLHPPALEEDGPFTVEVAVERDWQLPKAFKEADRLRDAIKRSYATDTLFSKVLVDKFKHCPYSERNGLITIVNQAGERVVCVPDGKLGNKYIRGLIIEQAHEVVGHFGPQKTSEYIRRLYWWPGLNALVETST